MRAIPRVPQVIVGAFFIVAQSLGADIIIRLKPEFVESMKDRATIDANFTVDKAHAKPNPPSKDGDLHIAGRAPEIRLATVAEIMNAKSHKNAVDSIHMAESSGSPVSISGVWRIWCEHGGDQIFHTQGKALQPFTTTNPDHVFEVHPVTRVGTIDLSRSLRAIHGFTYKDAEDAFRAYERTESTISVEDGMVVLRTDMVGYNYVDFEMQLTEEPTHIMQDGALSVFASVYYPEGDLLVRKERMIIPQDSEAFGRIQDMSDGDTVRVLGIPRLSFSLISWRLCRAGVHPLQASVPGCASVASSAPEATDVLDWSLPYEIVVVGVLE